MARQGLLTVAHLEAGCWHCTEGTCTVACTQLTHGTDSQGTLPAIAASRNSPAADKQRGHCLGRCRSRQATSALLMAALQQTKRTGTLISLAAEQQHVSCLAAHRQAHLLRYGDKETVTLIPNDGIQHHAHCRTGAICDENVLQQQVGRVRLCWETIGSAARLRARTACDGQHWCQAVSGLIEVRATCCNWPEPGLRAVDTVH